MKNTNKATPDPIARAKKHPQYENWFNAYDTRLRIGVEFYNARKRNNLSQQKLAKLVGITQNDLSNIENGAVNIGIDRLQRIAKALEIPVQIGNFILKSQTKIIPESRVIYRGTNTVNKGQTLQTMPIVSNSLFAFANNLKSF